MFGCGKMGVHMSQDTVFIQTNVNYCGLCGVIMIFIVNKALSV